nr:MAG TPA: hypothetical protein [Caudoviricetes sp.]
MKKMYNKIDKILFFKKNMLIYNIKFYLKGEEGLWETFML